ncbi:transposase [Candidatus Endobugula sertula]|uniref:Transposase n=1 Tax=Candidatus Endobugula sertula TaxID=62101 RepID=A0A1D2QLT3_9GAMM|nr:transposase [Candidatus Endobugula sertula]
MIQWDTGVAIYLHRDPVDFRKSINGLSVIVDECMGLSPFESGVFVFCNRRRDKLKVLYWDKTGFALWYKRLEKDKFKWPRKHAESQLQLTDEQWDWLLRGLNFLDINPHQTWTFSTVN